MKIITSVLQVHPIRMVTDGVKDDEVHGGDLLFTNRIEISRISNASVFVRVGTMNIDSCTCLIILGYVKDGNNCAPIKTRA